MSNKCKNTTCDKEVVSIEGRRPKEFCSVECRTKFHNSKKATGTGRGRPKGSKNKHNAIDQVEADNRNNPLTNAARGRDEGGVNKDEIKSQKKKVPETDTKSPTSLADLFKGRSGATSNYINPKRVK